MLGLYAVIALALAACNSNGPTASPSVHASPSATLSPSPTPQLIGTITLVAQIAEPASATPSGLTWAGIQSTGKTIGAQTRLVQPTSNAEIPADLAAAAAADRAVVVTIGPDPAAAVEAAAAAHSGARFVELGVVVGPGSPANVHGITFDTAEAGYLAGFVAAVFSTSGEVGLVGAAAAADSANYAAGFGSGAILGRSDAVASYGHPATPDSPDAGRGVSAALIKGGADVLVTPTDLTGVGALRDACARGTRIVAIETDAWQTVPDVRPCLVASVLLRYDTAAAGALATLAAGRTLPALTVEDIANEGISLSDFHAALPSGFDSRLAGVLAAMRNDPPRATAPPPSGLPTQTAGSVSPTS